jgi:chemotaxis protein CheD
MSTVFALPLAPPHLVVGVGDMMVSKDPVAILSTYALASCIGLVAYDSYRKVGGMLHFMLPDSTLSTEKAAAQPAMFADTGLPQFFRQLSVLQVGPPGLQLLLAGGANVLLGHDPFRIGERNLRAAVDFLARNRLTVRHAEVGGSVNRSLHLEIATGMVTMRTPTSEERIPLGA